jgi:hypothetical protein
MRPETGLGMKDLTVAVFSYNRGTYLSHCLDSIARNLPGAVVRVYDDRSDDPLTCETLRSLAVPVVQPDAVEKAQHGGLYANMQRAFDQVETPYLLFLQDDMQVVRHVDTGDLAEIAAIFAADADCALISPLFMKAAYARKLRAQYEPAGARRSYRVAAQIARADMRYAFADVCLMDVARMRAAGFQILPGEGLNEVQAKEKFSQMPVMADPFAFYCPEVPTFRNRKRPLSGRLARLRGLGFHDLTAQDTKALRQRPLDSWPFAEDFLTPVDPQVRRPFVFQDFQGSTLLRVLARLEYFGASGKRRLQRWRKALGMG